MAVPQGVGTWRAMSVSFICNKNDKNQIVIINFSVGAHMGAPLQNSLQRRLRWVGTWRAMSVYFTCNKMIKIK